MAQETLKLLHKDALADEKLTTEQLEEPLKGKVIQLESDIAAYEANPGNEKTRTKLQNLSGKLAHEIKDFAEKNRPDDNKSSQQVETPPVNNDPPPPPVSDPPPAPPVEPPVSEPKPDIQQSRTSYFDRRRS